MSEENVKEDSWVSTDVYLQNNINQDLILLKSNLSYGIWIVEPLDKITGTRPYNLGNWFSGSNGFMTGTGGYVIYANEENTLMIKISWDNPFIGSNYYSGKILYQAKGESYDISYKERTPGGVATVDFYLNKN